MNRRLKDDQLDLFTAPQAFPEGPPVPRGGVPRNEKGREAERIPSLVSLWCCLT
jgi:hypothetical protein